MGPYTQLHIRRTANGSAITVKVLKATAERLGWWGTFPEAWDPAVRLPESDGRGPWGEADWYPNVGGNPSGAWLVAGGRSNYTYPRLRFRVAGPWTRSDLETLRAATVPELHAITAGALQWRRLTA